MKLNKKIRVCVFLTVVLLAFPALLLPQPGPAPKGGARLRVTECNDHVDNDGDGYCDFKMKNAYCIDGSIPGDPDCSSKNDGSEGCAAAQEVCDGRDNNCNGLVDENDVCATSYYCDSDSDGSIGKDVDGTCSLFNCIPAGCSRTPGNDCSDTDPAVNPAHAEVPCNGIDDNCDGQIDEPGCNDDPTCKELFPGVNDAAADRVNVVFVGLMYADKNRFISDARQAVDYYGSLLGTGLLELATYKDNKSKFNFWYADRIFTPDSLPLNACTKCYSSESAGYCQGLANKYVANLCCTDFRGCAYLGGSSYIATAGPYYTSWPYVFDHEFQHQFPRLYDEYTEAGLGDRPGAPNCAADIAQAQSWWGSMAGQYDSDGFAVGYFDGCSYVTGNYRPTSDSIMRSWRYNLGRVNERHVAADVGGFSGLVPPGTPLAVEVTLEGNPDDLGSYEVTEINEVKVRNPVKENRKDPDALEIRVGGETFVQSFDTYDYLVAEDFSIPGRLSLVDFQQIPRPILRVTVPTGKARLNRETRSFDLPGRMNVPFSVSLSRGEVRVKDFSFTALKKKVK
jgi:hypothetical protein